MGRAVRRKECHNCIFISGTRVSDVSVHTHPGLQKLKTAAKSIGTAEKQAARQVFVISDWFQNTIAYVMQL